LDFPETEAFRITRRALGLRAARILAADCHNAGQLTRRTEASENVLPDLPEKPAPPTQASAPQAQTAFMGATIERTVFAAAVLDLRPT